MNAGNSVGDFTNFNGQETRNMNAICLMRTDVLRIDKGDYVAITREAKAVDSYVVEFLNTITAFYTMSKQNIVQLSQRGYILISLQD
jgi:hypothetical protein